VSRICKVLDADVEAFRNRAITGEHPYLWLDATFHKVRELGRVVSVATVVAVAVTVTGERQVLHPCSVACRTVIGAPSAWLGLAILTVASGTSGEPPDADPHVRWCGRGGLGAC
jgi:hypothetical protein